MLVASIAALGFGPALQWLSERASRAFSLIDGFVVVAVLGLALLEIAPEAIESAGAWALVAVLLGLILPRVFESRVGGRETHRAAAWVALAGMAVHAVTDGIALGGAQLAEVHSHALEWAVILHHLPEGLAVWWMLTSSERGGQRGAALALVAIAVATVVGYFLVGVSGLFASELVLGLLQAFVAGLLLHVVSHGIGSRRSKQADEHRLLPGIGGLVGLAFVLALFVAPHLEDGHGGATLAAFWELILASAPALLLAYGIAGLIGEVMGEAPARWLGGGGAASQALRGVAFGLPLPLCSCGVVPVYRSLIQRGVPASAALAFLVATPELGLDAVLLSVPLLGGTLTLVRVLVAFVLALIVGWFVGGWFAGRKVEGHEEHGEHGGHGKEDHGHEHEGWPAKLRAGLAVGYGEIIDSTGPWILVGLLLAAFVQPWLDAGSLTKLAPPVQVAGAALIGLPVYVCATGATPLVAVLLAKGLSPGAALAFLLTGPATNATTFGMLSHLHGRKVAWAFVVTMVVTVVAMGMAVNLVWSEVVTATGSAHVHGEAGTMSMVAAVLLGLLFVVSLLRQGPRRFLGRLWEQGGHDHAAHDHDHEHDHDGHEHEHASHAQDSCCH